MSVRATDALGIAALLGTAAAAVLIGKRTMERGAARTSSGAAPNLSTVLHADPGAGPIANPHVQAARQCNHSAALLALSVLADSTMEHYRGSFDDPVMYAPPVVSLLTLAAGLHGGGDDAAHRHRARHAIFLAAGATGLAGTAFHLYNVTKRPGGLDWQNLFYAAPIGAPMALLLSGVLGFCAERLRDSNARRPELFGRPASRVLALAAGIGLAGTAGEAALLHFRGSFQHRAMYAPVVIAPIASALLMQAALRPAPQRWFTRLWLRATTALGCVGALFHARGIARHHGGWRVWSQNLYNGPPLPAPPSFSALALAGLAALHLEDRQ